ncbi:MAG: TIM-barrel domain-containing protein [Myxococcales bacterium]|jgi:alpha-glucosidase
MRSPIAVLLSSVFLFSCSSDNEPEAVPDPEAIGDFRVRVADGGLSVAPRSREGAPLLESYLGGAEAYAPVATRKATAKWEMSYGSFKVTEGSQRWREAKKPSLAGAIASSPVRWADEAGEVQAELQVTAPSENALLLTFTATDPAMNRLSVAFKCVGGDRFLGFGAQADALDHRGHKIPIWTSEPGIGKSDSDDPGELWMLEGTRHGSSMGLPTWLSQRGYIGVVESDARSVFELCSEKDDAFRIETWAPTLKLWLFYGPEPAKALERATAGILGRPPRPPPLAFAPWNDAIYGAANVRAVAELIREKGIPSSAIWTEDFRGGFENPQGYRLKEEWELDPTLYPDAEQLAADLHELGFAWFAYFNTFLVKDTRIFEEAAAGNHFVLSPAGGPYLFDGVTFVPSGLADLSRAETREWVKGYLGKALDVGFDGWMADFGEWLPHDAVLASGEDPLLAHNRYPDEWARLNAEVLAERASDGRQRLFFSRAGWLGTTRHVPVFWAGDQRTSFQADDGMPTVVTMGLNLGLAGVSTYGHDIAGYQSATNPPSTKELFFRWTSLGALSPVMRTHHGIDAKRNWWFGKDEETIAHFKRWAQLHIQLFPYFDGCSAVAESTGLPIMRALPLEFPDFEPGWAIKDEYLLGPALLVAPVLEEGKARRTVHLPPGRWIPWKGGDAVEGPVEIEVDAPLEEVPLFARAGSVVPMLPESVQTLVPAAPGVVDLDDVADRRTVRIFAGGTGSFVERDGTRYAVAASNRKGGGFFANGERLPECASSDQRGCVASEDGAWRVKLAGEGPLEFEGHEVTITGTQARVIDLVVVR